MAQKELGDQPHPKQKSSERLKTMYGSIRDAVRHVDQEFRQSAYELFSSHLEDLKNNEAFVEIPTFERADYTAFYEYREDEPDELDSHDKGNPFVNSDIFGRTIDPETKKPVRGIRVYKQGRKGSKPGDYYTGKSLELYLLENGGLLECDVENIMSETPMSPTSHTTTKIYLLRRRKKEIYQTANEFINRLDILQIRDLLYHVAQYCRN